MKMETEIFQVFTSAIYEHEMASVIAFITNLLQTQKCSYLILCFLKDMKC